MLKKTITYEDFNGETQTEDFYFNLTQAELVELEVSSTEGFAESLQDIVKSNNGRLIIDSFKRIILMSYGQKSEDGKRFVKNDQIKEEFASSAAYSELFVELSTDAGAAAAFVNAVIPQGLAARLPDVNQLELPSDGDMTSSAAMPVEDIPRQQLVPPSDADKELEVTFQQDSTDGDTPAEIAARHALAPEAYIGKKSKDELEAMSQPELLEYFQTLNPE